jgi:hypothetical protein
MAKRAEKGAIPKINFAYRIEYHLAGPASGPDFLKKSSRARGRTIRL